MQLTPVHVFADFSFPADCVETLSSDRPRRMGPGVGIFLFVSWEIRGGRFQGHPRVSGGCPLFRRETKEGMPSNPLIPGASSMTHNKPIWSESKLIVEIKKYLCLLHIENSTVSDKVAEPCAGLKLARNIKSR
jgi:hypothetical protein